MLLNDFQKNTYAEENQALVHHVAKKFMNTGVPHDELVGVAYIGFTKALNTYDDSRNVKFSTYAYNCMKNEILFFLRKEKKHRDNNVSMELELAFDKDGTPLYLGNTISTLDDGDTTIEDKLILKEVISFLNEIIDTLNNNEQYIIIHRFGIDGAKIKTQKEIADHIGMSQANVSKLEKTIVEKIKRLLSSRYKVKSFDI